MIGGVTALVALAIHGATYLALKTEGDLQRPRAPDGAGGFGCRCSG